MATRSEKPAKKSAGKSAKKSAKPTNPTIEVIPDSKKIWGWNTQAWDLPPGVVADLGLDYKGKHLALARDWGWHGW